MSRRTNLGIGAALLLVGAVILLACLGSRLGPGLPAPAEVVEKTPAPAVKTGAEPGVAAAAAPKTERVLYIARQPEPATGMLHTILATRKGGTTYQALIRYNPQHVPLSDVPGLADVLQVAGQRGQQLPQKVVRIDQETEALLDNLGQQVRSITSLHYYLNPLDGKILAYDLANSTGGQAQRFVGHITRHGVTVEVYHGSLPVDRHEIPFPGRETFVLPPEMEFIHQWYKLNPEAFDRAEPVKFSIFIPHTMTFVLLVAKPLGSQVVPIKDANYDCARYDVRTISTQSAEGLQARQEMWFDKRSGLLMKRQDFETSLASGDAPVTERAGLGDLAQVRALTMRPPEMPDKTFPYQLGQELNYIVRIGGSELGRVSFQFERAPLTPPSPQGGEGRVRGSGAPHVAKAKVNLGGHGAVRHETAVTCFDRDWRPVSYLAEGDETAEAKSVYKVEAKLAQGKVVVTMQRKFEQPAEAAPLTPPSPPGGEGRVRGPAAGEPKATPADDGWKDPLKRVPVSDEEAKAQEAGAAVPQATNQTITRDLSYGTFLYDFNRVEHLAALAYRFPLPTPNEDRNKQGDAPNVASQKAALYIVRQNRSDVVMFNIVPEGTRPPRSTLSPRGRGKGEGAGGEPQLYVATADSALLPCRLLLAPDGRLLELALKHGSQEVVYTLDDPIMRHRAERAKKQKLQEGPQLLRPPWW